MGDQVAELAAVMRRTSICGLGQVALGPVMSVTKLAHGAGGAQNAQHGRGNGHGS
jgi:NADH:ubiquinone oxidoreductase subunit F (NADH-binding)